MEDICPEVDAFWLLMLIPSNVILHISMNVLKLKVWGEDKCSLLSTAGAVRFLLSWKIGLKTICRCIHWTLKST